MHWHSEKTTNKHNEALLLLVFLQLLEGPKLDKKRLFVDKISAHVQNRISNR